MDLWIFGGPQHERWMVGLSPDVPARRMGKTVLPTGSEECGAEVVYSRKHSGT